MYLVLQVWKIKFMHLIDRHAQISAVFGSIRYYQSVKQKCLRLISYKLPKLPVLDPKYHVTITKRFADHHLFVNALYPFLPLL